MSALEEFKKAHRAAARIKDDQKPAPRGPESPATAFSQVGPDEMGRMLANAQARAGEGLDMDVLLSRRLGSVFVRSAFIRQCVIVTQRQRDYLEGLCPFPREEIQALKILADLVDMNPGYLLGEKSLPSGYELGDDPWDWDV